MKRATIAIVTLTTLLVSGGVSAFTVLQPVRDEHSKLEESRRAKLQQRRGLEAQAQELEARLKRQAIQSLAYFDLRRTPDKRREIERKTIETLASLTEIFNDRHIVVQTMLPKAESAGFQKPVPASSPGADLMASASVPTPAPQASPTPPPATLIHKPFQVVVRGEYEDIVSALQEIEALPRAISINQYEVALIRQPGETAEGEDAAVSPSALELRFECSITFLLDAPSAAPAASVSHHGLRPWTQSLWHLLMPPAHAAELEPPAPPPAPEAPAKADAPAPTPQPSPAGAEPSAAVPANEPTPSSLPAPPAPPEVGEPASVGSPDSLIEWGEPAPSAAPRQARPVRPRVRRSPPPRAVSGAQRSHRMRRAASASAPASLAPNPAVPQERASVTAVLGEEPSLRRPRDSAYQFPIARSVVTGRRNPFVPLRVFAPPKAVATPGVPGVPLPPPALPIPAAAAAPVYVLSGILMGGEAGSMAVVQVGEKTLTVGIEGVLPGGARVVGIGPDHIVLDVSGRRTTLKLPR